MIKDIRNYLLLYIVVLNVNLYIKIKVVWNISINVIRKIIFFMCIV